MAYVSSIAMEGKDRDRASLRFVGRAKEEGTQSLAVRCRDREFFVVFDPVLRGTRNVCASSWWDVAWVDDLAGEDVRGGICLVGEASQA